MKKFFEKALFYLFVALVLVTPLLFTRNTAEVYEFPKMFFVYFIGATIILLWFLRGALLGFKKIKWPDKFITAYLGITFLSVLFSSHLYTSVWGYYSRFNGGLISILIFFGIYCVGINFLTAKKIDVLKEALLLPLLPISLYGISQVFTNDRVYSTLGQPNWLAAYLAFLFPLLIEKIFSEADQRKRKFWVFVGVFALSALWFTHSLSGVLALILSVGYLIFTLNTEKKKLKKFGFVSFATIIVVGALSFGYFRDRVIDAVNLSTDSSTYSVSDPGLIRMGLWKGSLRLATASPKVFLFGTGPETFPYEYPFFRDGILNYSSEWDFILNKPHNFYLELFVESGIAALLVFLLIFINYFKVKNKFLVAGMIAFMITNFFGWPTVATSMLFWMWLVFGYGKV